MTLFTLRRGIISTGWIAEQVVRRGTNDVVHKVTAVGSRSAEKAQKFINEFVNGDKTGRAYGTYDKVYADKDRGSLSRPYLGTPHTYHYTNALDALKAKKHVLCEKPVTCNAAELRSLITTAKENGVFFMEAPWTRFQPLAKEVKELIDSGTPGLPVVVHADFSVDFGIDKLPLTHPTMLDPKLGGGGPYPLIWTILALYEHPANKRTKPSNVTGTMYKTPITGVDCNTSYIVTFSPNSSTGSTLAAQAVLSCSMNVVSHNPGVTIRFEKGTSYTVQYFQEGKPGEISREDIRTFEYVGSGWHFQADEVARCVRDGKLESELWSHDKSILEMQVRRQGGYRFPDGIEKVPL
ncbi:NAD(P)-binding protein [Suillus weaverae]|nr:NAD(P)-binding protein [Suillus weaverae]